MCMNASKKMNANIFMNVIQSNEWRENGQKTIKNAYSNIFGRYMLPIMGVSVSVHKNRL